jgi:hypothetical protein
MPRLDAPLDRLPTLSAVELRGEWQRLYGTAAPNIAADLLRMGLAYRLQEKASGTRALSMARLLSRSSAPAMKAGTRLLRTWNGRDVSVTVTDEGYLFEDRSYRSLSAIAREVTGTAWSGPRFFGLTDHG